MIDLVFWFERGRTDGAVARTFDGERFHTGTGRDFLAAIADCIRERFASRDALATRIPPGRQRCDACAGAGAGWAPVILEWVRCAACGGVGHAWLPGGPAFGCTLELGDRLPGEIVELGSGERGRVAWQSPRKEPRVRPVTTFVALIDDFTDEADANPIGVDARIGVRSVAAAGDTAAAKYVDLRDGEKDADAVDPIARRQREAAGEGDLL